MYPWLRLAAVGVQTALTLKQSRTDLFEPTRISLRVWPGDLDANLHVNNGRYLSLADLGRINWFVRSGVFARARAQRALPVIADAFAKFRRELKLWQTFEIETQLVGWEQRYVFMAHRFLVEGRVIGVVAVRCVFKAGRRTIYPSELFGGLTAREKAPPLPAWLSHFDDSCEELSLLLRQEEHGPDPKQASSERQRMN
jgi:acyl-CoA thioesterase FadM